MIFLKNKTVEIQPVSEKTGLYRQKKKELLFEQAYFEIWFKYYQEHWFFFLTTVSTSTDIYSHSFP